MGSSAEGPTYPYKVVARLQIRRKPVPNVRNIATCVNFLNFTHLNMCVIYKKRYAFFLA